MGTVETPSPKPAPRSRVSALILAFNLLLLGSLLYKTFGRSLTPSGGVSVSIANDLPSPMIGLTLEHPGGKLELPRLDPGRRVGQSIADVKAFDAVLSFEDEEGHAFKETFRVKPLDEFLILIDVRPVLEGATVKPAEGPEVKVLRASTSKVRITTAYQPPVSYN